MLWCAVLCHAVPAGSDLDFALAGWVLGENDRQIELYEWNNLEQQYVVREAVAAGCNHNRSSSTRNMHTCSMRTVGCLACACLLMHAPAGLCYSKLLARTQARQHAVT